MQQIGCCFKKCFHPKPGNYWWTLRHMSRGHVLGCDEAGEMRCRTRQVISDGDLWHVQLLPAPGSTFFALKCGSRKRFAQAHANDLLERVQMDAGHAWGDVALFQMFHLIGCEYALRTTNGGWLRNDGICSPASNHSMTQPSQLPVECSFAIEPVANCIAFRDFRGLYLTGSASATLLKSKSDWAGKDEQFELQPASLQIQLRALFNQKWLSTRQG